MTRLFARLIAVLGLLHTNVAPAQEEAGLGAGTPINRFVANTGTDAGNCSAQGSPCATIGYAVSQANGGDSILVMRGTYPEGIVIEKSVAILGDYDGNFQRAAEINPSRTIIDGEQTRRPVAIVGAGVEVVLDGLRITNGRPDFSLVNVRNTGGGIVVHQDATLRGTDLLIDNNLSGRGVAVAQGAIFLHRCHIEANGEGGISVARGTGIISGPVRTVIEMTDCAIRNNRPGGGLSFLGGDEARVVLRRNVWENNAKVESGRNGWGGGAYIFSSRALDVSIEGDSFVGNQANAGVATPSLGFIDQGGGLALIGAGSQLMNVRLTDVTFSANNAGVGPVSVSAPRGGGIYMENLSATFERVTFIDNNAALSGGGLHTHKVNLVWHHGLFAGNRSQNGTALSLSDSTVTLDQIDFRPVATEPAEDVLIGRTIALAVNNSVLNATNTFLIGEGTGNELAYFSNFGRAGMVSLSHWTIVGGRVFVTERMPFSLTSSILDGILEQEVMPPEPNEPVEPNDPNDFDAVGAHAGSAAGFLFESSENFNLLTPGSSVIGPVDRGPDSREGSAAFRDPDAGDFRIGTGSAAIDCAQPSSLDHDFFGEPRPRGGGPDKGAHESDASAAPTGTPTTAPTGTPTANPTAPSTATAKPTNTLAPADTPTPTSTLPAPTETAISIETPTPTAVPTGTASDPSPTTTAAAVACIGDCDGGVTVTVDEIVTLVNIALGTQDAGLCPAGDGNGDGGITVDEILVAIQHALNGCPLS